MALIGTPRAYVVAAKHSSGWFYSRHCTHSHRRAAYLVVVALVHAVMRRAAGSKRGSIDKTRMKP
ncbi:MAG TPA: hypothetical protein VEZ17_12920 [Chitinophagaceae bacterium]|nr:hypothetical protein [Chitinophagaceae bacterium]